MAAENMNAMDNADDRVRGSSPKPLNSKVEQEIKEHLKEYSDAEYEAIDQRVNELENEWDVERALILTSASNVLVGMALGIFVNRKWFALSAISASFLLQHSLQGWCPPLPIFRKLGYRSRKEIDREKYAMKAMRGDFRRTVHSPNRAWQAVNS